MNIYMILKDGIPPAFYREDVHGPMEIPAEAPATGTVPNPIYPPGGIEITEDQWIHFLTKQPFIKWDPTANSNAGDFVEFAPPVVVPPIYDISDRQFFQQLAIEGDITEDEALAYVGPGTLPRAILAGIAQLPANQQFSAKMLITGATTFQRASPLAPQLGAILSKTDAELDNLWRAAALL